MYHIVNHESYKEKGEHVMQQVVIFFGSVAKPKSGVQILICHQVSGTILVVRGDFFMVMA